MMNAKQEFLRQVEGRELLCAKLHVDHQGKTVDVFRLKQGYTGPELEAFLKSLDFDYTNDSGPQKLFGTAWHTDETWSVRTDFFGDCEFWTHRGVKHLLPLRCSPYPRRPNVNKTPRSGCDRGVLFIQSPRTADSLQARGRPSQPFDSLRAPHPPAASVAALDDASSRQLSGSRLGCSGRCRLGNISCEAWAVWFQWSCVFQSDWSVGAIGHPIAFLNSLNATSPPRQSKPCPNTIVSSIPIASKRQHQGISRSTRRCRSTGW